jgi:hypothetical protein
MLIAALLVGAGLAAPAGAQDQSAATPPDTIFARKTAPQRLRRLPRRQSENRLNAAPAPAWCSPA